MRQFFLFLAVVVCAVVFAPVSLADDYQSNHLIGPGDVLSISVYQEADLSLEVAIDKSGVFEYPFLGQVRASNITTQQLAKDIDIGLRGDYLVDPEVSVSVSQYRPYYVNGEVRRPSGYPYVPGVTVIKAVTLAGGFTPRAAKDRILIQREGNDAIYRARDDTAVRPGDVITIKESLF